MKASTMLRIGDIIRKLREDKHWTQKTLSEKSGVHEVQIRRYENNQSLPRDAQLSKIASALGVDKDYFFNQQVLDEVRKMDESVSKKSLTPLILGQDTLDKPITAPANAEDHTLNIDEQQARFEWINERLSCGKDITKEDEKFRWEYMKQTIRKISADTAQRIQSAYNQLNQEGKLKAAEQIELLTRIPEYQKKPDE